jgi:hypothetical protein
MIALLMLFALHAQDDTGAQFFKFKKETSWTWAKMEAGQKMKVTARVIKEEEGRVFVEEKQFKGDAADPSSTRTLVYGVEGGFLRVGLQGKDAIEPLYNLYKLGSKKGDSWGYEQGEAKDKRKVLHLGVEEVTVPAGTLDLWLAPKVGVVKEEVGSVVAESDRKELAEFTEGK